MIDLLTEEALTYEADGKHHAEPVPADLVQHEHDVHDRVVEEIVAGDDEPPLPRRRHSRRRGTRTHARGRSARRRRGARARGPRRVGALASTAWPTTSVNSARRRPSARDAPPKAKRSSPMLRVTLQ